MSTRSAALILLCALALPQFVQAQITRDSSGVRIVESGARLVAPLVYKLGDKPTVSLEGAENNPKTQFYARAGARAVVLRLRDGRIVIGNGKYDLGQDRDHRGTGSTRLMYFSSTGVLESTVNLQKPFTTVSTLCEGAGDTLIVGDTNGKVFGILDGKGKVIRTVPLPTGSREESCFADGTFLISAAIAAGDVGNHLESLRTDGTVAHDFGWLPYPNSRVTAAPVPSFVVRGNAFYHAGGAENEIKVYSPQGLLLKIFRFSDPLLPITTAQLARGDGAPPIVGNVVALDPMSATWPAYGLVKSDPTGRLWVGDYERSGQISRFWTAIDPNGKIIGRLAIPATPKDVWYRVDGFYGNEVQITITDNVKKKTSVVFYPLVLVTPEKGTE